MITYTKEHKEKIKLSVQKTIQKKIKENPNIMKTFLGRKHTKATRLLMSKNNTGNRGRTFTIEHRRKMREGCVRYIEGLREKGNLMYPRIGHNEEQIISDIEKEIEKKITRQFKVAGYFVDGYCKETNTIYEVDEYHHNLQFYKEHDKIRQDEIQQELNCKFVRIGGD